jgi:hypothetical protein
VSADRSCQAVEVTGEIGRSKLAICSGGCFKHHFKGGVSCSGCLDVGLKQPNPSNQKRIMQIRAPNAAQAASFNLPRCSSAVGLNLCAPAHVLRLKLDQSTMAPGENYARAAGREGWVHGGYLSAEEPETQPRSKQTAPANPAPLARQQPAVPSRSGQPVREPYVGTCDCLYDLASNGTHCGGRSAYSQPDLLLLISAGAELN